MQCLFVFKIKSFNATDMTVLSVQCTLMIHIWHAQKENLCLELTLRIKVDLVIPTLTDQGKHN